MEQEKKIAAAMAAVMQYLQSIQVASAEDEFTAGIQQPPTVSAFVGLWALSGRQAAMQTRNLMQMKSFHGARLR